MPSIYMLFVFKCNLKQLFRNTHLIYQPLRSETTQVVMSPTTRKPNNIEDTFYIK